MVVEGGSARNGPLMAQVVITTSHHTNYNQRQSTRSETQAGGVQCVHEPRVQSKRNLHLNSYYIPLLNV